MSQMINESSERGGRFIQPCILLSLRQQPLHGYGLLEKITAFGFSSESLDISVVYRHLKKLEEQGMITSDWDTQQQGAARKVYSLTGDGIDALKAYRQFFEDRMKRISAFLTQCDALLGGE